ANAANKELQRTGDFWQVEYYDRLIRDERELKACIEYVLNNPIAAKLGDWPWLEKSDKAIEEAMALEAKEQGQDAPATQGKHGQDARATELQLAGGANGFSYIKSRLGIENAN